MPFWQKGSNCFWRRLWNGFGKFTFPNLFPVRIKKLMIIHAVINDFSPKLERNIAGIYRITDINQVKFFSTTEHRSIHATRKETYYKIFFLKGKGPENTESNTRHFGPG